MVNGKRKYVITSKPVMTQQFLRDNFSVVMDGCVKKGHLLHLFLKNTKSVQETILVVRETLGPDFTVTKNDLLSLSYVYNTMSQNVNGNLSLSRFIQFCDENFVSSALKTRSLKSHVQFIWSPDGMYNGGPVMVGLNLFWLRPPGVS